MQLDLKLGLDSINFSRIEKRDIFLIENNTNCSARRVVPGVTNSKSSSSKISVQIHRISKGDIETLLKKDFNPDECEPGRLHSSKIDLSLLLLEEACPQSETAIVVAGATYGTDARFIAELRRRNLDFVLELRPSLAIPVCSPERGVRHTSHVQASNVLKLSKAIERLPSKNWITCCITEPTSKEPIRYSLADLGLGLFPDGCQNTLFVAQRGSIRSVNRGTICALSSLHNLDLESLTIAVGWNRWIRPVARLIERTERNSNKRLHTNNIKGASRLATRPNLAVLSQSAHQTPLGSTTQRPNLRGVLLDRWPTLNIAELFSGAGGMGLGFLMANSGENPYRLVFSGEVNPIYVQTLSQNHKAISKVLSKDPSQDLPEKTVPVDLRDSAVYSELKRAIARKGDVQILIGGPPCQGFSSSNRNSGGGDNPNNRLFNVFLDYVEKLRPAVFLLENVQGVAWARNQRKNGGDLLTYLSRRMEKAGYLISQKLLDAAWYGVPQYRYRFFAVGIRQDLGYTAEDFGAWGPYPQPTHGPDKEHNYVTVRDAIGDLPEIGNGYIDAHTPYKQQRKYKRIKNSFLQVMRSGAEARTISDHVTSRHAEYVIERYAAIPEGGNWESIKELMTNYSNVSRTHSNIYRRLTWDEPSITIGHYRKSMLIHPSQNRGLSWREAARLQSFPDWARFAGNADEERWTQGLVHKQQQLANAVCPLLTKAVAEFILQL